MNENVFVPLTEPMTFEEWYNRVFWYAMITPQELKEIRDWQTLARGTFS